MKTVTKDVRTAFFWELRKEGEIREIFLVDRFVFFIQRVSGQDHLFLPCEWADADFARRRAITLTERAEIEGLTLWGNVFRYGVWRDDEELVRYCDDSDFLAVFKLIGFAQTRGTLLA